MSDLIDRQDVLDAFLRSSDYLDKDMIIRTFIGLSRLPSAQPEPDTRLYSDGFDDGYKQAIKDAQPEQRWIPCSERLPENGRQVLVYARSVHYALAKYDEMREADGTYKKQWVTFDAWKPFYTIKEVIAWMPLPEGYRGEQE